MPVFHFNKNDIVNACKEDIEKLKQMAMQPNNIDVIPWMKLWEIVLQELNKKA